MSTYVVSSCSHKASIAEGALRAVLLPAGAHIPGPAHAFSVGLKLERCVHTSDASHHKPAKQ